MKTEKKLYRITKILNNVNVVEEEMGEKIEQENENNNENVQGSEVIQNNEAENLNNEENNNSKNEEQIEENM